MSEEPYQHSLGGIKDSLPRSTVELELNSRIVRRRLCKKCHAFVNVWRVKKDEWEYKNDKGQNSLIHRLYGESKCPECSFINEIVLEDEIT